jgi:glycerophosphoryl diester phosphodiesterase
MVDLFYIKIISSGGIIMSKKRKNNKKKTVKKNNKKIFVKIIKALALLLAVLVVIMLGATVFCYASAGEAPAKEKMTNPFIKTEKTYVSAHRSGADIAPENTMMAFQYCVENEDFNVDTFEFDLHITKDNKLILLHDDTLDRTTNAEEQFGYKNVKPSEKTYDELKVLNFGENFETLDGEYPYRNLRGDDIPENLKVVLLEDVLNYLQANGDFTYIIEIKDKGENGFKAADELYKILKEKNLLTKVVFGTFNGDVTKYVDENYPDMLRSSSIVEVVLFYLAAAYNIDLNESFYKFDALQIPTNQYGLLMLGSERVVNYAHRHNLAVQYWTINDEDEVKRLSKIGADCIMSDVPDMAYDVINN